MRILTTVLVLLVTVCSALAQGVLTAQLDGTVRGPEGVPLEGVTVTVKSPALMGERQTVTGAGGEYVVRGLPPGEYTIDFTNEGMQSRRAAAILTLGTLTRVDAVLQMSAVRETIMVTGSDRTVLENTAVGANITTFSAFQLPVVATPIGISSLAGGLSSRSGIGRVTISGGMDSDNLVLINGLGMQDQLSGTVNNLFIEDAIQEVQVLTSGIPAEYGHFTGGVINVITNSGGNRFTGLVRDTINKPSWLALTPYEKGFRGEGVTPAAPTRHTGDLSNVYELTLGGPVAKDRLWFFLALRDEESSTPFSLPVTGYQIAINKTNRRPEYKLTGAIASNHTLLLNYINNPEKRDNEIQGLPIDTTALLKNTLRDNHGYMASYQGVLTANLFAEARYASKVFEYVNFGGTSTDAIDSPMESDPSFPGNFLGAFNAPYFDATDPESRNDRQYFASASYFVSARRWGTHDIKGGWEEVIHMLTGGNSQAATDRVFYTGYSVSADKPVLDVNGHLIPVFAPYDPNRNYWTKMAYWFATRGAELETRSNSYFVNDRWTMGDHWSFNLGVRHEVAKASATDRILTFDTSNTVPRLAVSFDPQGNGQYKLDVTYGEYSGRVDPNNAGRTSAVGHPSLLYGYYVGPAGEGRNFAPGFDPKNYLFYYAWVPTGNILVADGLHAPVNHEWAVSAGMRLPKSGWAKVTFTDRQYSDLITEFTTMNLGCTNISLQGVQMGCFDNVLFKNSNVPRRDYQGVELQASCELTRAWSVRGNWTHQLKNEGGGNLYGSRPEMQSPREDPRGTLGIFEADRIRLWTTYRLDLHRFGNLTTGVIYRYDSPSVFSYGATVKRSAISKAKNPGYHNAGNQVVIYFGERGSGRFNATSLFDVSLGYSIPVAARMTPWVKLDVSNVLNDDTLISWNTTVLPDPASPKDDWGYATGYTKGVAFGRPAGASSYIQPRLVMLSVGVRF